MITANGCSFVLVLNDRVDLGEVGSVVENIIKHTFGEPLEVKRFLPRLRVSWQEAFMAVKRTIGLKHLPHCEWLFDWNKPADVVVFTEEFLPELQEVVAENGGMVNLPNKIKELLHDGMMDIVQSPGHRAFEMVLGFLPIYFGKSWYFQSKRALWPDFLRQRDEMLRDQLTSTGPAVGAFLRQIGGLQFNGAPDKIMYLVNITEGAEGKAFWYQYHRPSQAQYMSMGVRVTQRLDRDVISFALTLCRHGGFEGFSLAAVLQKAIQPGMHLVLRDFVHEIKMDVETTNDEQRRSVLQLVQLAYANTTADIPVLHTAYQRLSEVQQKQFLRMCFEYGVIAKSAGTIFLWDRSFAWLREGLLAEVRADAAMLPVLINSMRSVLDGVGILHILMPIIGGAAAQEVSRDGALSAAGSLLDAMVEKIGTLNGFIECIEEMIPYARFIAESADVFEKIVRALNGKIGLQLQWDRIGRLTLIRALVKLSIAADSERGFVCVSLALTKNLQTSDVEQDKLERLQEAMSAIGLPGGTLPGQVMLGAKTKKFIAQIGKNIFAMPDSPQARLLKDQLDRLERIVEQVTVPQ